MGAEAGTLAIMCGGQKADYERLMPVLQAMGKHLFHVGEVGSGSFVKLMNNYLIGVHTAALAETFTLASKAGVDTQLMREVIAVSTGDSKMLHRIVPLVHERDFAPRFSNELLHKDMKIATELAASYGIEMPVSQLAEQMYALAKEKYPKEDMAALFKIYEEKNGVIVKPKTNA
jgi:3-hydroxyisobutyrate dehydrogenase/2-hydroxy-3-oxopropionate reductase